MEKEKSSDNKIALLKVDDKSLLSMEPDEILSHTYNGKISEEVAGKVVNPKWIKESLIELDHSAYGHLLKRDRYEVHKSDLPEYDAKIDKTEALERKQREIVKKLDPVDQQTAAYREKLTNIKNKAESKGALIYIYQSIKSRILENLNPKNDQTKTMTQSKEKEVLGSVSAASKDQLVAPGINEGSGKTTGENTRESQFPELTDADKEKYRQLSEQFEREQSNINQKEDEVER